MARRIELTELARRGARLAVIAAAVGGMATLAGCGTASAGGNAPAAETTKAPAPQTVHIDLIGKVDADSGAPGTFTGKEGWPALAPSTIKVPANATVVLTIKEYDDVSTPLPDGSPYNDVKGGTETVDGQAVTNVANDKIAHTFTIPELGLNAPIPMAPQDGFTTVTFTFQTGAAGTYTWRCFTPCGGDPNGMGGAMTTDGWMQGQLAVG